MTMSERGNAMYICGVVSILSHHEYWDTCYWWWNFRWWAMYNWKQLTKTFGSKRPAIEYYLSTVKCIARQIKFCYQYQHNYEPLQHHTRYCSDALIYECIGCAYWYHHCTSLECALGYWSQQHNAYPVSHVCIPYQHSVARRYVHSSSQEICLIMDFHWFQEGYLNIQLQDNSSWGSFCQLLTTGYLLLCLIVFCSGRICLMITGETPLTQTCRKDVACQ